MDHVGPLVCPVLVGRDDLLELASRRLGAARRGSGHLLFLAGEAGIGKTRLLQAIETRAGTSDYRVVRGATFPRDLEVAAAPFLDLARAMARHAALAQAGRELGERLAADPADASAGDAHRRRRLLVLDVVDLLVASAADGPVLLALEDLHWADDLSLEILAGLARRLPDAPLLVVATYRSDELYPRVPMREWRARLLAGRLAEEARLGRLGDDGVATMTALLLHLGGPPPRDLVAAVRGRTDGVPLHVEELLGALVAGGRSGDDVVAAVDVPQTLEDAILGRLALRSPDAQEVAQAGAVIGRSFEVDLLAAVLDGRRIGLDRALAELTDHFVLVPAETRTRYDFRHALIRDAIYGRIAVPMRRRLHARVAELVAASGTEADAFLSVHFEEAGLRGEAFRVALAAARRATQLNAHHDAYTLHRRALRNVPEGLADAEHARVLEAAGRSAAAADDNAAAVEHLAAARERYGKAGLPLEAAGVVAPLVAARHLLGADLYERTALLREALAEVDAVANLEGPAARGTAERFRARLLAALSAAYMLDRRLDESVAHGEAARALAVAIPDPTVEVDVMATLGSVQVFAGRMTEGWAVLEAALGRARDARREVEAARAYRMIATSASVLVEYERAEALLREGIDYAERVELWNDRHYMSAHLAHVLWATGRWGEADAVAAHALADGRGGITTRITALHVLGYVALGRGDLARARELLGEARELGERMGELQRLSPALWGLAEVALASGDPVAAASLCERGRVASLAVDDAAYLFPFLVTGTRALLAAGDPGAAERWVAAVRAALERRSIPGTLPAIDHADGLLALAQGSTGRARTLLERAVASWDERDRRWEWAGGLLDLATCHLRAHRPAAALQATREAREAAERWASGPLVARADGVARAARARHPDTSPWAPLTAREWEVARLVAAGLTNAAIAGELGIAPKTVSAHVEHILARLGVGRRAEIAAWVASTRAASIPEA